MATQFTSAEWRRIREKLEAAPEWWGLPKGSTAPCSLAPSASVSWDRLEAATSIRGSSWPTSAAASTCWPSRRSWTTPQRLAAVAVAARAGVQHGGFGPDRRCSPESRGWERGWGSFTDGTRWSAWRWPATSQCSGSGFRGRRQKAGRRFLQVASSDSASCRPLKALGRRCHTRRFPEQKLRSLTGRTRRV